MSKPPNLGSFFQRAGGYFEGGVDWGGVGFGFEFLGTRIAGFFFWLQNRGDFAGVFVGVNL
jgi:hypothetical protein